MTQLRESEWTFHFGWLTLAGTFYLVGQLPPAMFWRRLLVTLGQRPDWLAAFRAYYIGHLGKYVPGKALVVVLRAGLVRSEGVSATVAALAVFIETLGMMAVGSLLAAVILTILAIRDPNHVWMLGLAVGLIFVAGVPTFPPVFRFLVRKLGLGKIPPATLELLDRLGWKTLLSGWILMAPGWVLQAWGLWAVLKSLEIPGQDPLQQLPLYLAAMTTAVVAGFLSLIPGGLGVRDGVLVFFLKSMGLTPAEAVLTAILQRLVTLLAELAISGILYPLTLFKSKQKEG